LEEKAQLLTQNGNYVLSNGLARGVESRIEENSSPNKGNPNTGKELTEFEQAEQFRKGRERLLKRKTL
jgi:hypothetical protein